MAVSDEKPARFYLSHEDDELYEQELKRVDGGAACVDPANCWVVEDIWVHDLQAARAKAVHKSTSLGGKTVFVYERVGFYQVPFSAEVPGLLVWEWDNEMNLGSAADGRWRG